MISNTTLQKEDWLPLEEKLELQNKQKQFTIGVPKEMGDDENRVSLVPQAVEILITKGHKVLIETDAGAKSNFTDLMYSEVGAVICNTTEEVYNSDIIVKVAPPCLNDIDLLKNNSILFSFFTIELQDKEYITKLQEKNITAIGYEFFVDENGNYPIVQSMSEITGTASILIAAEYLSNAEGGKGEMLGGVSGVSPSEIVILGADTAGEFAARTAIGLGANVKVFDSSIHKLRVLQDKLGMRLYTSVLQPKLLDKALTYADVVIGALFPNKQKESFIVSEVSVKKMKQWSVIIDLYVDNGGCFETTRAYNHTTNIYKKHGVIHYCVPNISSRVARTASYALSNILEQLIEKVGDIGSVKQLIKQDKGFAKGIYIYNGIITKEQIANKFNLSWQDISLLADIL